MSGVWGRNVRLSIFGESHGKAIGVAIDGLPPGIELDLDYIGYEMRRRAPGQNEISTPRKEKDEYEILSGYFNGRTTGTPLCAIIHNNNQYSKDYDNQKLVIRPGHADYTGNIKYQGFNDYRGGGHFSGRLTAPIVFAGAICKKILEGKDITIGSHIKSIGKIEDRSFNMIDISDKLLKALRESSFPAIDEAIGFKMKDAIIRAKEEKDSVGGVIESAVINLPAGIGQPFFDSVESTLAHLLFSIPGVKGVEFGAGFDITKMSGSQANDEYYMEKDVIKNYSNNNGGIIGGITNGMPLIFRVAIKPTPSIGKVQRTVNIDTKENTELEIVGRHDACIVLRALPVIEAAVALAVLDLLE